MQPDYESSFSIPEPTPSTMTALHQFGAEMLKLSRGLESFAPITESSDDKNRNSRSESANNKKLKLIVVQAKPPGQISNLIYANHINSNRIKNCKLIEFFIYFIDSLM